MSQGLPAGTLTDTTDHRYYMWPFAHCSIAVRRDCQAQRWSFHWACKTPHNSQTLLNYECLGFAKPSENHVDEIWRMEFFSCHFICAAGYLLLRNHRALDAFKILVYLYVFIVQKAQGKCLVVISIKFIPGYMSWWAIHSLVYSSNVNWGPTLWPRKTAGGKCCQQKTEARSVLVT